MHVDDDEGELYFRGLLSDGFKCQLVMCGRELLCHAGDAGELLVGKLLSRWYDCG